MKLRAREKECELREYLDGLLEETSFSMFLHITGYFRGYKNEGLWIGRERSIVITNGDWPEDINVLKKIARKSRKISPLNGFMKN